jgi:acetate kinase
MGTTEIMAFLKDQVALFREFTDAKRDQLIRESRIVTFDPGEAIIKFGEEGLFLGVVLDGEAEASVTDDAGDRHVLAPLKAGDIFGEMALMTGNKAMADVIAGSRCRVLLIPQRLFSTDIATDLHAVSCLSRIIVDRFRWSAAQAQTEDPAAFALRRSEDPYGFALKTDTPMKLLVINCGSSSLKYDLFDTVDENGNARGMIERIGQDGARHTYHAAKGDVIRDLPRGGHAEAFAAMAAELTAPNTGVLRSASEVSAVGHRVVHGGEKYSHQAIITDDVIREIEKAAVFAPLHNPVNLTGIREAMGLFPDAPHVAVFDTAFHQVMPPYAYLYGLPYEYFEQKRIRRYGFHGASHKYVSLKVAQFLKRPYNGISTIVCHLGNGASVCAIDHGRSVDTSMGLTPAEGLLMGTRCGDIDPAILVHLMRTEGLGPDALDALINKESGLKGLSGVSNDMREIVAAAEAGNHRALLAIKTFSYRVRKYIGAYVAAMGDLDALAFTGGIGQGSVGVRSLACQGLGRMGIVIDEEKNRTAQGFDHVCDITGEGGTVRVLVVPTDEERMIARETLRVLGRRYVNEIIRGQAPIPVPIEVSAHHVHLTQEHVEALFGKGYALTSLHELSQPGQYACNETVGLVGPKGAVDKVRILGPTRKETQVEIAMTEQFKLGIHPPIRESGCLDGTPGITLEGAQGTVVIDKGVICALRHIHMTPEDALRMGLKDKDSVLVRVQGDRELTFGDVLVRVSPNYRLAMHVDTDEGNAAHIPTGATGYVEGIQSRR